MSNPVKGNSPRTTMHQVVISSIKPAKTYDDLFIVTGRDDISGESLTFSCNAAIMEGVTEESVCSVVLEHRVGGLTTYITREKELRIHERDGVAAKSIIPVKRVLTMNDAIAMNAASLQARFGQMFVTKSPTIQITAKSDVPEPEEAEVVETAEVPAEVPAKATAKPKGTK